ncbi:hypothetical protein Hanom_Chr09g00837031 [Helianthus anomalus]
MLIVIFNLWIHSPSKLYKKDNWMSCISGLTVQNYHVDALEMMGKDSGSALDPTQVFYDSAFTPDGRLLWRVQLLSCGRRLEIFSGTT